MEFLYKHKLREPMFTDEKAKAIDVLANTLMNDLY